MELPAHKMSRESRRLGGFIDVLSLQQGMCHELLRAMSADMPGCLPHGPHGRDRTSRPRGSDRRDRGCRRNRSDGSHGGGRPPRSHRSDRGCRRNRSDGACGRSRPSRPHRSCGNGWSHGPHRSHGRDRGGRNRRGYRRYGSYRSHRDGLFRKGDYLQKCGFLSNRLAMCIDFDKFLNTAELVSKAEYNADIAALMYLDMVY